MSVMRDNDPANTLPGSGNLSALDATSPDYGHPAQEKIEKPRLPKHILVVEDDASLAGLEADVLTASGYTVTIASSGELAVVAFQQAIPDLIVLDLELAGTMTGWDVLHTLRTHSRVPVLLTSSLMAVGKRLRTRGETRLTLDHLPKPYPMQTLLKRIERMLVIVPQ